MEINAEYLKKLCEENNRYALKADEILEKLVKAANNGNNSYSYYINEEDDNFSEFDIDFVKEHLTARDLSVKVDLDISDNVRIWELYITW